MNDASADVTTWSAGRIAAAVRAREVTAEAVLRVHLDRIGRLDADINAFQVVRSARALEEARQLDARPDLGALPLAGVPVAIKDNVDVAGEPTRHGSVTTPATSATADDELVRRLRAAGCIVIGKTKMPELAIWPVTESEAFGDTRNPWNRARTTGGSSGGSGAALAARMAALALGSDGGGSIRIPSACCGVAGIKPGPGVIPLARGQTEHWYGLSEFGPMARTAADVALMFDALSGTKASETNADATGLRIAVSTRPTLAGARVDAEVQQAVTRMADLLANSGHRVQKGGPRYPMDLGLRFGRYWMSGIAQDAEGLPVEQMEKRTRALVRIGRWIRRRGWDAPVADDEFGKRMREWFRDYDVLLTPTLTRPAVPVGKWRGRHWITTMLGVGNWLYTTPWNIARFPAASIPTGPSSDGLPIGLQLVAPPGGERRLLALMVQIEQLQPWLQWAPV